ncbi:MAG: hypothetical protein KYX66_11780 [Blastomonas fulva]|uniref:phosphorylase family protein n=1 Tax=Blastomonas fulva TaxID=1550728 RepID=UPI0024E2421B|nr:hypothetical protein [Blastomonas fulva]MDK2757409.1 hypothetical protein [Blastomonas fulva]
MRIHVANYRTTLEGAYGLILTANSVEKLAVDLALAERARADIGRETVGAGLHYADPHIMLHLTGAPGGSQPNSVGRLAKHMLVKPQPRPAFILLVGFGWGDPNKTCIGDVLVATEIASINRRIEQEGTMYQAVRPVNRLPPASGFASRLQHPAQNFSIVPGPMASLEAFIANNELRDELLAQFPEVVGGEMEAYDFLPDCDQIPWAVIKGVSDHGGNDTDKEAQKLAAANAASLVLPLIRLLAADGHIAAPERSDMRRQGLESAITGKGMSISWRRDTRYLNDYLNDELWEPLLFRLDQYAGDDAQEGGMLEALTALILEIVQNSIRHGRSPSVEIDFNETKVVVSDQAEAFDLAKLQQSAKGGGDAWRALHESYLSQGYLTFDQKRKGGRNNYSFRFEKLSQELQIAKRQCSASIERGAIGALWQDSEVLSYPPKCETLHVDVKKVFLYSRRIDLATAIGSELEAGKKVFIECANADQAAYYQNRLAAHEGPQLRIYVKGRT